MAVAYNPRIVTDGLVLYLDAANPQSYPGTGTTWNDISTNRISGTLTNGPTFNSNNKGYIIFDGTNDYALFTSSSYQLQSFSIAIWVYPQEQNTAIVSMLDYNHTSPAVNWVVQSEDATSNGYYYLAYGDGSNFHPSGNFGAGKGVQLIKNEWQYLVFTKTGTTVRGYRNSVELLTATATNGTVSYTATQMAVAALTAPISGNSRVFKGYVPIVKIYNRALSSAEISQNYNALKSRFTTPTVVTEGLILRLDAGNNLSYPGSGTTWTDLSGFNNHMTIVGSPTYSSTEGFTFDGTVSKYIIRNPITMPTTTLSAEIWVKTTDSGSGIISYSTTEADNAWLLFSPNNLQLYVSSGVNTTGVNIATGTWKQVVRTSNRSTGEEIIYVNGVVAYTGTLSAGITLASGGSLVLAQEQDSVGGGFSAAQAFDGNIASFNLYNRILTAAEVAQNFNALRGRFGV